MASFDGYLYSKLNAIGSRSEGPAYFLQQWDYSEIPVLKNAHPWAGDSTLHAFVAQKVTIHGVSSPQGIQYDSVTAFQTSPVPVVTPPPLGPLVPVALPGGRATLRQGSLGLEVRHVQERLRALGYNIVIDGYFGGPMRTLVEEFQSANGLRRTGDIDLDTLAALG